MGIHEISIAAHPMFEIFGVSITNTFILSVVIGLLVFGLFSFALKQRKMVPEGIQNFIEFILEGMLGYIEGILGDRKKAEEIFPLATTIFFLILACNLSGIVPGLGVFSLMRAPTTDINFTLGVAMSSMALVHIMAMRRLGVWGHIGKFLNFKSPILLFVGMLEGVGEITKTFSLAIRLFGNLFAGEVLMLVVHFLCAFMLPLPFIMLELLVAVIQPLIFASLIIIFYGTASTAGH